jgi:hypothetical protein
VIKCALIQSSVDVDLDATLNFFYSDLYAKILNREVSMTVEKGRFSGCQGTKSPPLNLEHRALKPNALFSTFNSSHQKTCNIVHNNDNISVMNLEKNVIEKNFRQRTDIQKPISQATSS